MYQFVRGCMVSVYVSHQQVNGATVTTGDSWTHQWFSLSKLCKYTTLIILMIKVHSKVSRFFKVIGILFLEKQAPDGLA